MSAPRALSVVVPAYNEERRLAGTIDAIAAYLRDRKLDAEILIVDDGSRDRTVEVAQDLARKWPVVRVLGYEENQGKGYAVKVGALAAQKDTVVFSDADHSTPIREIEKMWPWLDKGYEITIGSRRMNDSDLRVRQPFYRETMGKVFGVIVALLAVPGFRDTQCGFKVFKRAAARQVFGRLRTRGFAFDVELLIHARKLGYRVREVGVEWLNSLDSRVSAGSDSLRMLLQVLRMRRIL